MEKLLHIEILTPFGKYLSTDADFLSVTSSVAVLGILPNHTPLITDLGISKLEIKFQGKTEVYAIGGGVLNILKNSKVILLLNSIESKNEIDIQRAKKAQKRAEELLIDKNNIDIARAKTALERALNRIAVFESK